MKRISKLVFSVIGLLLSLTTISQTTLHSEGPVVAQNNNIGIGAAPGNTYKFYVKDTSSNAALRFHNISGSSQAFLRIDNGVNWGLMLRSGENNPSIGAANVGSLSIRPFSSYTGGYDLTKGVLTHFDFNTMRVGIGTATPGHQLHVIGETYSSTGFKAGETAQMPQEAIYNGYQHSTSSGATYGMKIFRYLAHSTQNTGGVYGIHSVAGPSFTANALNVYGIYSKAQTFSSGTATNAYSFFSDSPTGSITNAFNIYANGTGKNYFGGKVGIGTTSPSEKLEVTGNALIDGEIYSKKVKVSTTPGNWPDYVFAPGYQLKPLGEVEAFIKANKHLPEVPSAKEVEEKGLDLGSMDATLLKKMEEMTLYMIEMKKEIETLKKENQELKKAIKK